MAVLVEQAALRRQRVSADVCVIHSEKSTASSMVSWQCQWLACLCRLSADSGRRHVVCCADMSFVATYASIELMQSLCV